MKYRISMKDPAKMTARQINSELDRLAEQRGIVNSALISAGRGYELHDETIAKDDPISISYAEISNRTSRLMTEVQIRFGSIPLGGRLPVRGFGARKS